MKRFCFYLLLVIASEAMALFVFDRFNLYLVHSASGISSGKVERLYSNPEPDEIPILGSSVTKCGYEPSLISPKCFNYGEDGCVTEEVIGLLEKVVARPGKGIIIYNLDPWGFKHIEGHRVCDYSLVEENGVVFPYVRFFGKLRANLAAWINERHGVTKVVDRGAVLIRNGRSAGQWEIINSGLKPMGFHRPDDLVNRFFACVDALRGKRLMVVVTPCTKTWRTYFTGEKERERFLDELRKRKDVFVVDCYKASDEFTDDFFVDPTHLNMRGARMFSNEVKRNLVKLCR